MSGRAGMRTTLAALAAAAVLIVPTAADAAGGAQVASTGDGPNATKSGAIVNWVSGFKLSVSKATTCKKHKCTAKIQPLAICSVDCSVSGTGTLKGLGGKAHFADSATFGANFRFGLFVTVKGGLLRLMRQSPGKFHLSETLTATDPATGATDTITRTFGFKR
jgi:hypothetical protein